MACAGSNDPNDHFDPPKTPQMVLRSDATGVLSPDTEENVREQTEGIFRNFVYQMHTLDRSNEDADNSPSLPEITAFVDQPFAPAARIGRQLAVIGDDINVRYTSQFNGMIRMLNLTPETAYEAFAGVARKLFKDGRINWGRIVTLLCFGYRLAVTTLQRGIRGFFSNIISFVVRFVVTERISQWIAEQGGWGAALRYVPETMGWTSVGLIFGLAALSVITAMYLARKS